MLRRTIVAAALATASAKVFFEGEFLSGPMRTPHIAHATQHRPYTRPSTRRGIRNVKLHTTPRARREHAAGAPARPRKTPHTPSPPHQIPPAPHTHPSRASPPAETFDKDIGKRWTVSEYKGADSMGKWVHTSGEWFVKGAEKEAKGMQASEDMKFHAISAPMDKKASTTDGTLVVQFTVKHEKKDYAFCGGGYIKLMPGKVDGKAFGGDTPYSIMFGPDLCGYDVSRIHLIFEHNGENLLKEDEIKLDYADKDEFTHLYTLVLEKDGSYEVFLDQDSKASGNIVDGWAFPDKEVKDPDQSKPADWVDTKKIPDPESSKPEGYDDIPAEVPDPEAETPEDWDEEEDGEWHVLSVQTITCARRGRNPISDTSCLRFKKLAERTHFNLIQRLGLPSTHSSSTRHFSPLTHAGSRP